MAHLVDENGNQVTEEEDVLRLIHGYYRDLYTQPELDKGMVVERRERSNIPTRVLLLEAFQEIHATLTPGATQKQWEKKLKELAEIRSMLTLASPGLAQQTLEPSDPDTILTIGIASLTLSSAPDRAAQAALLGPTEDLVRDTSL
ncbi:hypothetical protein R1sor_009523 [Riccia sorocarpa]|uniref:Uncharacterized protein n=1 Tax=Riccia sorocarpa TaxID=122646 RepID=A0ABD3HVB5_9MARC